MAFADLDALVDTSGERVRLVGHETTATHAGVSALLVANEVKRGAEKGERAVVVCVEHSPSHYSALLNKLGVGEPDEKVTYVHVGHDVSSGSELLARVEEVLCEGVTLCVVDGMDLLEYGAGMDAKAVFDVFEAAYEWAREGEGEGRRVVVTGDRATGTTAFGLALLRADITLAIAPLPTGYSRIAHGKISVVTCLGLGGDDVFEIQFKANDARSSFFIRGT